MTKKSFINPERALDDLRKVIRERGLTYDEIRRALNCGLIALEIFREAEDKERNDIGKLNDDL